MNKYFLIISLFILVACGTSDIDTGQQVVSPEPRLITVTGVPKNFTGGSLEPISTPIKTESGLQFDGAQARYPTLMHLTTAETVTITLSDFQSAFAHEKYRLLYDPSEWVRIVDGKEVPHEERIEPYPKDGWVFKPTTTEYATITFIIIKDDPASCEQCIFEDLEVKYYNFLIEPAK